MMSSVLLVESFYVRVLRLSIITGLLLRRSALAAQAPSHPDRPRRRCSGTQDADVELNASIAWNFGTLARIVFQNS